MSNSYNILYKYIESNLNISEKLTIIYITLSLLSNNRNIDDAKKLFEIYKDNKNILNKIFHINLKQSKFNSKQKKTIASCEYMHFGGQLHYLLKKINNEKLYNYIYIISQEALDLNHSQNRIDEFLELPFILINSYKDIENFDFLDLVIFNEGFIEQTYFAKNTIRVMQPHGLDIPSKKTILTYGGDIFANYILAPLKEDFKEDDKYLDLIPKKLIEHNDNKLCVVPFGYPKLDDFIEKHNNNPQSQKKIIFHCSHLDFLSDKAKDDIAYTLKLLIDNFTNHTIIFRPYPNQLDMPAIKKALKFVYDNQRVKLSLNSSYIDDYIGADFLVSHRIETAQTFAHATKKPIIYFPIERDNPNIEEHPLGFLVYTHRQLLEVGKNILKNNQRISNRIYKYTTSLLNNVGSASDYFIENLPYMLQKKKHPDWYYYKLYDKDASIDLKNNCIKCFQNRLNLKINFENIARISLKYYKDDIFLYYLSMALLLYKAQDNHYYYFHWYEAIGIISKLSIKKSDIFNLPSFSKNAILEKAYILKNYIDNTNTIFHGQYSTGILTELEIKKYKQESIQKIQSYIKNIINNIDNDKFINNKINIFFQKNINKKILIWGSGEIFDKIKYFIPKNLKFKIVDKQKNKKVSLITSSGQINKINVENTNIIDVFNPDIILITSDRYCQEIKEEIKIKQVNAITICFNELL